MAQRPIWRGHLRLALVSCPVALYSARHERNSIRFNMLNPTTGTRIKMVTQDAETGEPLSRGETVKGYEFSKDHYRIVTVEETRLRAMFDAKIQGQPLSQDAPPPVSSNVIEGANQSCAIKRRPLLIRLAG